jgi:hypothetical protein
VKSNAAALLFVQRLCGGCSTVQPSTTISPCFCREEDLARSMAGAFYIREGISTKVSGGMTLKC